MIKKLLITLALVFGLAAQAVAAENFTSGWTETDPNSRLSQTSTRTTWTGITHGEDAYLQRNSAISLSGDYDIAFDFKATSASGDDGDSFQVLYFTGGGEASVYAYAINSTGKLYVGLDWYVDPDYLSDENNTTLSQNTTYYARYKRTSGVMTLDIYSTDANRIAQTSPLVSLSISPGSTPTFTGLYCPTTYDDGKSVTHTGYLENLDLAFVPATRRIMIIP